ncbi:MAG: hypothetical protein IT348_02530, partial [Candidatus Eisenbacteria bacterium]|nr:hypothetical protein [Candidatus Eisenbacteria bacterium]
GRRVAVVADGRAMPAGEHELRLDVRSLPAGVYLARLRAAGAEQVQRLLVVR